VATPKYGKANSNICFYYFTSNVLKMVKITNFVESAVLLYFCLTIRPMQRETILANVRMGTLFMSLILDPTIESMDKVFFEWTKSYATKPGQLFELTTLDTERFGHIKYHNIERQWELVVKARQVCLIKKKKKKQLAL
ncbi:hypothetical protein RFI_19259, partial [Reticulomyxa filosa]